MSWQAIVAIYDAAAPVVALPVPVTQPSNQRARRKPRSDQSSSSAADQAADQTLSVDDDDASDFAADDPDAFFSSSDPPVPPEGEISAKTLSEREAAEREQEREQQIADCAVLDHSDTDNGKRLICYFGDDLIVRRESGIPTGAWLHWTGTHWDIDSGAAGAAIVAQLVGELIMDEAHFIKPNKREAEAIDAGKAAAAEMREIAVRIADGEIDKEADQAAAKARIAELTVIGREGKAAADAVRARRAARRKHGLATKNRAKMTAMLDCAGPHIRVAPDDFNPDPLKVATLSHTLCFKPIADLECPDDAVVRTKWICADDPVHRRSDMITAVVPVAYDPSATCPRWRANIERFQPDKAQRRTLQQFTGAGLLGKPIQRVMFHYGTGGNFKSVFLETVTRVLGDSFAVGLPTESLISGSDGNSGGPRPDLERVFGKRMLRILELPDGIPLKADLIKKLTGGERWPVRSLYKSFYEFTPVAKPHMSANSYPNFDGSDGGMRRRLIVMEWPIKLAEKEQRDFDLVLGELLEEKAGILNWLIDGAIDYLESGLVVSAATLMATQEYFDEMDPTARFCRDCIEVAEGQMLAARDAYNAYLAHCTANARKPIFETRFGRIMKTRYKQEDHKARRFYIGIRLHDVPQTQINGGDPGAQPDDSRDSQEARSDVVDF